MSSTEKKDSPSKEEKKESTVTEQEIPTPPKPTPPKPTPPKPEQDEPAAPVFEKSFIDGIKNEFPDDVDIALSLIHI